MLVAATATDAGGGRFAVMVASSAQSTSGMSTSQALGMNSWCRSSREEIGSRAGSKRILSIGLTLQAIALGWIAAVSTPTTLYPSLIVPFILAGVGMALFTPMANLVLSSVRREQEGQASGANNAIRELGGVFGVAVLASVFSRHGGYATGQTFVNGMTPALWIGAVVVGFGAVAAFAIPTVRRERAPESEPLVRVAETA